MPGIAWDDVGLRLRVCVCVCGPLCCSGLERQVSTLDLRSFFTQGLGRGQRWPLANRFRGGDERMTKNFVHRGVSGSLPMMRVLDRSMTWEALVVWSQTSRGRRA